MALAMEISTWAEEQFGACELGDRRRMKRMVKLATQAAAAPDSAFQGQTPDEMYLGTGADVPKRLATGRIEARQSRRAANRALNCQDCSEPDSVSA